MTWKRQPLDTTIFAPLKKMYQSAYYDDVYHRDAATVWKQRECVIAYNHLIVNNIRSAVIIKSFLTAIINDAKTQQQQDAKTDVCPPKEVKDNRKTKDVEQDDDDDDDEDLRNDREMMEDMTKVDNVLYDREYSTDDDADADYVPPSDHGDDDCDEDGEDEGDDDIIELPSARHPRAAHGTSAARQIASQLDDEEEKVVYQFK